MSGYNLPDDFSWHAFCSYYGDDQPPEDEEDGFSWDEDEEQQL